MKIIKTRKFFDNFYEYESSVLANALTARSRRTKLTKRKPRPRSAPMGPTPGLSMVSAILCANCSITE